MSEQNQGNNPDASTIVPVKRKRGRPRKYPRLDIDHRRNANATGDQNLGYGENARASSTFGGVNGSQPHRAQPVNDVNESMVGQIVHGVIDAAFDAGYLLTVRVGTSDTTLRGVVFKPGHYVPVSSENDVAPGVQMIRRNEIPVPTETYTHGYGHGHSHRSRDRNGTVASRSNPVTSRGKRLPLITTQTSPPGISRGNMVPVMLHPVNVNTSNGSTGASEHSGAIHAGHPVSSKGKEVLDTSHPSNGPAPTNQEFHCQSQNNHQPLVIPSASGLPNQCSAQLKAEGNSMQLPAMPFEKLLSEVIKRVPVPPQPMGTDNNSADKLPAKDSGLTAEDDASDTDQPLSVEPLQSIQPSIHTQPAVPTRPLENYRTGKMTELLQVLQENMTENHTTESKRVAEDSMPKLDELKNSKTELGDDESDRSKQPSRASSL